MNVFDFDETIYDGESSVEFILYYLRHDLKIIKFLPTVFKVFFQYNKGKITFDDFTHKYAGELKNYFEKNNVDLSGLVDSFWNKRMHKIKPFYKEIQRDDDVIITASPYFMMEEICKRIGVKNLIATDFDIKTGEVNVFAQRDVGGDNVEAEGMTFGINNDGAVMHVLDYNKIIGVFVHHYKVDSLK